MKDLSPTKSQLSVDISRAKLTVRENPGADANVS